MNSLAESARYKSRAVLSSFKYFQLIKELTHKELKVYKLT